MAWVRTSRFEMPPALAIAVLEYAFLKVTTKHVSIMDQPVSENDFLRFARSCKLIDAKERRGIALGKLGILFNKILKHLPRLLLEREVRRYHDRDRAKLKRKPRKRKHRHKVLSGRTQLAVLMEELFKAIPASWTQFRSPLNLVLSFMKGQETEHG